MMIIQLGKARCAGVLCTLLPAKPVAVSWEALKQHAQCVAASPMDAGLAALTIAVAKQVIDGGGRVLVVDSLAGAAGDRLLAEFVAAFPAAMNHWRRPEQVSNVPDFMDGKMPEPVLYLSGPLAEPQKNGISSAMEVLRRVLVSKLARPLDAMLEDVPEWTECSPVLVILRHVAAFNSGEEFRAANVSLLHVGDGSFGVPAINRTVRNWIRIVQPRQADPFYEAVAVLHESPETKRIATFTVDMQALMPPRPPMRIALGTAVHPGLLSLLRRRKPYVLPWEEMRSHLRISSESQYSGDEPSVALAISAAKQVAAQGGRVIVFDPLVGTPDQVQGDIFETEFASSFPGMQQIRGAHELWNLAPLLDESSSLSEKQSVVFVGGEAGKVRVKQEGAFGKVSISPVLELIRMATFAKMLRPSTLPPATPEEFVPVLLILRHVSLDPIRCGMNAAELSWANMAILQLDGYPNPPAEETAFAKRQIEISWNRGQYRARVSDGQTADEFLVDAAGMQPKLVPEEALEAHNPIGVQ